LGAGPLGGATNSYKIGPESRPGHGADTSDTPDTPGTATLHRPWPGDRV